ncbi:hypothetical protein CBR_g1215 [Chara braunii]|uniref:Myb/SANT-like DNA-binding domain-containing protein n=1 Tax=Chara braunii TaxID=69332 RepID=A0A388KDF7_CHABU|nr:hypothetical protein CBR_g1215 [Chara braunii]|eukprot:GBG68094.1 hypothetical protein CBR_g1215 [Chara braunii]
MGTACTRMKPREWKWLDVEHNLKKVGVDREDERCRKKWDNLMQQFKKVHHFQGLSGKQDFFQFSGKERLSKGFNFNMDRAVYDEILGSTAKSHTINPKNVVDNGAPSGVRLPSATSEEPESVGDGALLQGTTTTRTGRREAVAHRAPPSWMICAFRRDCCDIARHEEQLTSVLTILAFVAFIAFLAAFLAAFIAFLAILAAFIAFLAILTPVVSAITPVTLPSRHVVAASVSIPPSLSSCSSSIRAIVQNVFRAVNDSDDIIATPVITAETTITICCRALFSVDAEIYSWRLVCLEVGVSRVMSSRGSGRAKSAGKLAVEAAIRERKSSHVANKQRKLVEGAFPLPKYVEDDKWVASQVKSDFEEDEEVSLKRKSKRRGSGALRIDDVGERRGRGGRAMMENVIDVNAAAASGRCGGTTVGQQHRAAVARANEAPKVQEMLASTCKPSVRGARAALLCRSSEGLHRGGAAHTGEGARAGGAATGGAPHTREGARAGRPVAAGASQAAEVARAGGAKAGGVPQAGGGARAGDVASQGEDDEALVNRVHKRNARDGIEAASKLWVDDIRIWNETVCVSPMVFHITLEMDMKLPLWFVGANIEDRHENDEMAAYQEASIQRLVGAFTSAISTAEGIDGGRVSHERVKSVAEAMRIMLAAAMWLMRMSGDDHRSHYGEWVFVQLTTKPTLIASMHRSFDAPRHIVQAVTAITDKLAKPPRTLVAPQLYIPDWALIGVKFSHDATLSSPMEAKKLDWLGTGPPKDEDDDKCNDEGGEGG